MPTLEEYHQLYQFYEQLAPKCTNSAIVPVCIIRERVLAIIIKSTP
jgi:hypothetical protein